MKAKCINEPRGDHGLEGYILNSIYNVEFEKKANPLPNYKIFHNLGYYEVCNKKVFGSYFKII